MYMLRIDQQDAYHSYLWQTKSTFICISIKIIPEPINKPYTFIKIRPQNHLERRDFISSQKDNFQNSVFRTNKKKIIQYIC